MNMIIYGEAFSYFGVLILGNIIAKKKMVTVSQHSVELSGNFKHFRPNSNSHFPPVLGVKKPRRQQVKIHDSNR